ncbi:MAG: sugar transferase [Gemmatimonadales bacterium]
MDCLAGCFFLVLAAPLILLGWLATVIEDGRPGFFTQERIGRDGGPFVIYKLRSMRQHNASFSEVGQVFLDHPLVTRSGRWLRRLKIDEMPQLLNVIAGQMSLVGPRPTIAEQVVHYDAFARRRLAVRPGLTGWAQVNGNATLSWDDRIRLDVWYVDHWTLGLDLRILWRTLRVVLSGDRSSAEALDLAKAHENGIRRLS